MMSADAGRSRNPKVSLCLPVWNGENFLGEALSSIVAQDFEDIEVIVSDNASTDSTGEIVQDIAASDTRVRYVRNNVNIGAAQNYNAAFRQARGEYIKWCAHDDVLSPNFLTKTIEILDEDPTTSFAFAKTEFVGATPDEKRDGGGIMEENLSDDPVERFYDCMIGAGKMYPIFALFRASQLAQSTLHRPYFGSDMALLSEMSIFGKMRIAQDAVFKYRLHKDQSIKLADRAQWAVWQSGTTDRSAALHMYARYKHLFEIARRHPDLAPASKLSRQVIRAMARPKILGILAFESIYALSPRAAYALTSPAYKPRKQRKAAQQQES